MEKSQKILIARLSVTAVLFGLSFIPALSELGELLICLVAFLIISIDVIFCSLKDFFGGEIFNEKLLMVIASIGAFLISEFQEAVAVMFLYQLGEFLQDLSVDRAKSSIKKLMDIRPDFANLLKENGEIEKVSPEEVEIGDKIVVYAGEKVPLDSIVISGNSSLDTSSLTGESLPVEVSNGSFAPCATINLSGTITLEVKSKFENSSVAKIIEMVENSEEKQAKTDKFITKFAKVYTPLVVALAVLLAIFPPLVFGLEWKTWINRALMFLVISCPCALVISIPLTFFAGIGGASRQGILIKGANHIETLAKTTVVGFDKTGTLTKGNFKITKIFAKNGNEDELIKIAKIAETGQTHPIAKSVENYENEKFGGLKPPDEQTVISGFGVRAKINGKTYLVGNQKLMSENGIEVPETNENGTVIFVADKNFLGYIVIEDEIQESSFTLKKSLESLKIHKVAMLTGDKNSVAKSVAQKIGFDEVYSELLPEDKVKVLENLKTSGVTAYVGDGINDAPVLKLADVGVAVGKLGSDIAVDSADVVLMNSGAEKFVEAVKISKHTMKLAKENIVFTIGFKVLMLILGALGIASMWLAIFADVGVSLLAVLNACRAFKKVK